MNHEFINPNYHVVLIHAPLGLLMIGTVIELLSFLWPRSAARAAGRWMIFLGALAGAPTALSGLYAIWDVNAPGAGGNEMTWQETRASSPVQGEAWEMLQEHAWFNGGAAAALLLLVVLWVACSDAWRRRLHVLFVGVLVGIVAIVTIGAWHGGEAVYRHGVGVEFAAHVEPVQPATTPAEEESPAAEPEVSQPPLAKATAKVAPLLPPLQMHVIMAGMAIAVAFAALGLSLRGTTVVVVETQPGMEVDMGSIAGAFDSRPMGLRREELAMPVREEYVRVPAARFWVLTTLFAALTAVGGWWVLASLSDVWDPNHLWNIVIDRDSDSPPITRRIGHLALGVAIVVIPLVLALIARFAPRQRILMAFLGVVLLAVVAAQVWLGSLLMLDSPFGTVTAFNGSEETKESVEPTNGATTMPATTRGN